jgi:hypothetical protein
MKPKRTRLVLIQSLLPHDWHAWVQAEAARAGLSVAGWLRKLVGEAFERGGSELDTLKGRVSRLEDEFARHLTRPVAERTSRRPGRWVRTGAPKRHAP